MCNTDIRFYTKNDPFFEFSNFYVRDIVVDGIVYKSTEHYYQSKKFTDKNLQKWVMNAPTPKIAAERGRDRSKPLRDDWDDIKDEVMYIAVKTKFTQHPDLQVILLSTNDKHIIEHSKKDSYWGNGGDDSGLNKLGIILEVVRDEIKNELSGQLFY